MPADPKLNEPRILASLRDEMLPLSVNGWRSLCEIVLMACYDRKVEREFFAEVLDLVGETQTAIDEIEMIGRMMKLLMVLGPDKQSEMLVNAAQGMGKMFMHKRRQMADKFALLCQCPTTADKIS